MQATAIQQQLLALQDKKYRDFHSKLLPGVNNIIGIRTPLLRSFAKNLLNENWQSYLDEALLQQDTYYEETIIQGLLIGTSKIPLEQRLKYLKAYIPKITNWAICDIFCSTLKEAKRYPEEYWQFITPYFASANAYDLRFAAVMLLSYYTDGAYAPQALNYLHNIKHEDYYVKMAAAWAISIFYIKQPALTLQLLQNSRLDKFTHNKAIQKIRESFRVSEQDKKMLLALKQK